MHDLSTLEMADKAVTAILDDAKFEDGELNATVEDVTITAEPEWKDADTFAGHRLIVYVDDELAGSLFIQNLAQANAARVYNAVADLVDALLDGSYD